MFRNSLFFFRLTLYTALAVFCISACACAKAQGKTGSSKKRQGSPSAKAQTQTADYMAEARKVANSLASSRAPDSASSAHASWGELLRRLEKDPAVSKESLRFFSSLAPYSPEPMGEKVKELYISAFVKKDTPPRKRPRIYRNIVTNTTMQKCRSFLAANKQYFDAVEKKYPVPREILVALMYVETRLGNYVGKDNALWSLACMAAANRPETVKEATARLPLTSEHDAWLQAKLTDKSDWAYKELRSMLTFCNVQRLNPACIPGSVYGAIGICQFMPSNLLPYGDDGNGDGVVNLFTEADAIFSTAKYLTKHGWHEGATVAKQRTTLKRYNNLNVYANTILTLAESLRTGTLQIGPPDMPVEDAVYAAPPKKAPKAAVKTSGTKKQKATTKASKKQKSGRR